MISSTRSFLSMKGVPLFLLTLRSFSLATMPAASQKYIDDVTTSPSSSTVSDFRKPQPSQIKHNQKQPLQENDQDSPQIQFTPFTIRLHLIRHGETLANERNIVLGQGDSPLTDKGLALARISAQSIHLNGRTPSAMKYWRTYTSDLYRAHRTAKIVLGLEDVHGNPTTTLKEVDEVEETEVQHTTTTTTTSSDDNEEEVVDNIDLIIDPRLRELAKGPREGYLKTLSFEEAMSRRLQEAVKDNKYQLEQKLQVPKLESISDAWGRATDWIECLVRDAAKDYYASVVSTNSDKRKKNKKDSDDTACNTDNDKYDDDNDDDEPEKIYNVFALSHSALIRTMIHKMVDPQLPKDYALTNEGSLLLPNLSRTVIDVRPYYIMRRRSGSSQKKIQQSNSNDNDEEEEDDDDEANNNNDYYGDGRTLRWKYRLVHLADVSHLSDDPMINTKRPPYL